MSSLARRSMRTTAAAAGIAALGVGFAGHAFAAPEAPALPGTDNHETPAAPGAGDTSDLMSQLPAGPSTDRTELPGVFVFEMPTITTATAPVEAPALPALDGFDLPELPAAGPELPAFDAVEAPELPEAGSELPLFDAASLPAAGPELPSAPEAPGTDAFGGIVDTDMEFEGAEVPETSPESFSQENQVGALPSMDTAAMFAEMAQKAMAGESLTENNTID